MAFSDPTPRDDVLSLPIRARLFAALQGLRRPATTQELAVATGRHPNTVRRQLQRLAEAGLVECRLVRQARGRPRHMWAIDPDARPGGEGPKAYGDLGRWLARALRDGPELEQIEDAARRIGRELAPRDAGHGLREAMRDALTALGFAPRVEDRPDAGPRYVLGNCPYREAVAENPALVCTLHRGITSGLLERLDPVARLEAFVAKDPFTPGCLVDVA
jgi:predicted ArsR family transcriptional regulator